MKNRMKIQLKKNNLIFQTMNNKRCKKNNKNKILLKIISNPKLRSEKQQEKST